MTLFSTQKCPSCVRQLTSGIFQQVRGKKKLAKATTILVRLLKDVPKFGSTGSLIPVTRGRMRTLWYPQKVADYVHYTELKKIPRGEAPQRDFLFLADTIKPKGPHASVSLLSPTKSVATLESFLPPTLQFSRATISPADPSLHGSVSMFDIASAVRMVSTANGKQGSRVVITQDQIVLVDVEGDKIKTIGNYVFEIRMKGTNDFVRRMVSVQRSED